MTIIQRFVKNRNRSNVAVSSDLLDKSGFGQAILGPGTSLFANESSYKFRENNCFLLNYSLLSLLYSGILKLYEYLDYCEPATPCYLMSYLLSVADLMTLDYRVQRRCLHPEKFCGVSLMTA